MHEIQESNKKIDDRINKEILEKMSGQKTQEKPEEFPKANFFKVEKFAEQVFKLLGKYHDKRDEAFEKFLGVKKDKMKVLNADFPSYKRSQAIYALNVFPAKKCKVHKITNLTSEGETAPTYENIRLKRDKYEALLTCGEMFLEWKGIKFILTLFFEGCVMRSYIRCRTEDEVKLAEFDKEFREFMREENFLKGEKLNLLSRGNIDFLEYPKLAWDDVILRKEIKEEIMLNIVFPLSNEKGCVRSGIPWRRGLLMGGLAGTGKTQVCRVLCNELPKGITVIWATPKALYDEEKIKLLFEAARYFSPTLIIIEDIDFIGTSRRFTQNPILGELLTQLDGNDPNHGVFVVGTTNRPELLDEALANRPSRFDVKIAFSLPNETERIQLVKLFTKKMKFEKPLDYQYIAREMGNNLTGAHVKEVFTYAQLKALKRGNGGKVTLNDILDRVRQYKQVKQRMVV